jgi:hypothetical protein
VKSALARTYGKKKLRKKAQKGSWEMSEGGFLRLFAQPGIAISPWQTA